jgi:Fur family peroxide stress response transcriptional regulator
MTHQRMEIYRELLASHGHPSVAEVYEGVRDRLPSVSLDTVYRTLRLFSELGIINPHSSTGSGVRFDVNTQQHNHFVCTRCGRTIDFTSASLAGFEAPEEAGSLGIVHGMQLEVRGICTGCLREEGAEGMETE